ncbi:hypothetical protein ABEB36_006660 [Hypothenemus hampei]|uniref:peptidyl-tRNA hydrolase n=1 Tax=Hypothenemus hampei TaxID=57062 RepID=A0ABD1ERB8_HYPHA
MSLIAVNSHLTVFSAGTLVGALSTYLFLKYCRKIQWNSIWSEGMEERYKFEDTDDEVRLILGVRNDLKMQKGKVAAQCGHGAMAAYANVSQKRPELLKEWLKNGGTKIAVKIDSEEELLELEKNAKDLKILCNIIRDAGQTQVLPGTRTVIAIGPARKSELKKLTGHLKLY